MMHGARIHWLSLLLVVFVPVKLASAWVVLGRTRQHLTARQQRGLALGLSRDDTTADQPQHHDDDITYRVNLQIAQLAQQCADPTGGRRPRIQAVREAYQLLRGLAHPDTVAYNSVLKALNNLSPARLRLDEHLAATTAAECADELLSEMTTIHQQQALDNAAWYANMANKTEDEIAAGPPRVYVKPNVRSYSTVMSAYARQGDAAGAQAAQRLLTDLQAEFEATSDYALQPNTIAYNTCLSALAKAQLTDDCLALLERMPEPDTISYNTALHALARSGRHDAGTRCQALLRQMPSPNARSYTTAMDAWSRCGRPEPAHALLDELLSAYDTTGNANLRPNCVSYSTLIHSYALSDRRDKAERALEVFRDMRRRGVAANRIVLNNLLHCCATSRVESALDMVESLYRQILAHADPDHYTFGTVLKAVNNSGWKDGGEEFAKEVFAEACRHGQVTSVVVRQLRQAVPMETYRELMGGEEVSVDSVPKEWRRNVHEERRWRRP